MDRKETLLDLLQTNRSQFHIIYKEYLSNHLPMALVSLYQLGATSEQMTFFYNQYVAKLEPAIPSEKIINIINWKHYLGHKKYYNDYREFFKSEVAQLKNVRLVLAKYLPTLMEGVIGSAFHSLLLLGYGIEILDFNEDLVIDGLAAMCYSWTSLGKIDNSAGKKRTFSPTEIFTRVYRDHDMDRSMITKKLNFPEKLTQLVTHDMEVLDQFDQLKIDQDVDVQSVLDEIAGCVIGLYSTTKDFFVLHGVTSCYAAKLALSCMNPQDKPAALRYYMRALVATYIVQGQPAPEALKPKLHRWEMQKAGITWDRVIRAAIESNEEHTIKLIWTCWKENKEHKREIYLLCSAMRADLISPTRKTLLWPWALASIGIAIGVASKFRTSHAV